MKILNFFPIFLIIAFILQACKPTMEMTAEKDQKKPGMSVAAPPLIIYKTKNDYFNNLPVGLSEDKTFIVSYPDPADLYYEGNIAYPTSLAGGYLLDNRGINIHTAFLKYTYEEFIALSQVPSPESLMDMLLDKDPFTDIYECKCLRDTVYINKMITEGLEKFCKKTK